MKKLLYAILITLGPLSCTQKQSEERPAEKTKEEATTKEKAVPVRQIIQMQSAPDSLKGSLPAEATGTLGDTKITITYYSPAVRGRVIWGGLVPFDQVWVTGAHMATRIEFGKDVIISGTNVPPGVYALFTIPGKSSWVVILNKNWKQHLADNYDPKQDVLRITVTPEKEETHQERLRYAIEQEGDAAEIVIYWEKLEISFPVSTKRAL